MANATGLIGVIVVALMGALSVFYYFDKERRARKKEADEADDRLINVLQKTIDNLRKAPSRSSAWWRSSRSISRRSKTGSR